MSQAFAAGFFRKYPLGGARPDADNFVHCRGVLQPHLEQKTRLPRSAPQNTNDTAALSRYLAEAVLAVAAGDVTDMATATLDQRRFLRCTLTDAPGAPPVTLLWCPDQDGQLYAPGGAPGLRRGLGVLGLLDALYVRHDREVTEAMQAWQQLWARLGPQALVSHWETLGVAADCLYGYLRYYGRRWYDPQSTNALACTVCEVPAREISYVVGWTAAGIPLPMDSPVATRFVPMAWCQRIAVGRAPRALSYDLMENVDTLAML